MRRFRLVWLVAIAFVMCAREGSAGEGDTRITDPAMLTRLGFPSDASNVYLARDAVLDQKSSPTDPEEFGTTDFGWTTVLGNQHHPWISGTITLSGNRPGSEASPTLAARTLSTRSSNYPAVRFSSRSRFS
jgi:hypothetical protein